MLKFLLYLFCYGIKAFMIPFADSGQLSKQGIHKISIPNNEDVAVWWDLKKQKWCSVNDVCPHRQASLSSGVVTHNGNIKCPYHGIEFNGCGNCRLIPSSESDTSDFCVKNYFIQEKYGLLWISKNRDECVPVIGPLETDPPKFDWFVIKQNIPVNLMIENSIDILHADHVHHGMLPFLDRNKGLLLETYSREFSKLWLNETGFACELNINEKTNIYSEMRCEESFFYTLVTFPKVSIILILVPFDPSKTMYISSFLLNDIENDNKGIFKMMLRIINPMIKSFGQKIYEQDHMIFESQIKNIENKRKINHYIKDIDLPIILYNKWTNKYIHGEENDCNQEECEL